MKLTLAVLVAFLVAGCVPTYVMQNPTTGEIVQCHGDAWDWNPSHAAKQCAKGYEAAGWKRLS